MADILFVAGFPKKLYSSSRFRIEIYENILISNGHSIDFEYFWSKTAYETIYTQGNALKKFVHLLAGFKRRFSLLFRIKRYDYIFVLREATPIGPPVFEWLCTKLFRKKLIYDFDDAIWIQEASHFNPAAAFLKAQWKVGKICSWAHKVSVGNRFLYDYAKQFNPSVVLNPTCVDTRLGHNRLVDQTPKNDRIVLGWTGTFSTLKFLYDIIDVLQELENKYNFEFIVIADQNPQLPLKHFTFIRWNESTEIEDLMKCQIGLMPLKNDAYSEGKCGFKLIQYMSLGMPVLASPIGVNREIIEHGTNGFLCNSREEWINRLEELMTDTALRIRIGQNGRQKIIDRYSLESNGNNFLSLFND